MERHDSRDWLELVRPGRLDPDLPARPDLSARLVDDPALRAEVARTAEFDRRAALIIQNVPTPAGLKAGILARLAEETTPSAIRRRMRRRWLGGTVAAAACLLLAGAGWLLIPRADPAWTIANVRAEAFKSYGRSHAWPKGMSAECGVESAPTGYDNGLATACGLATFLGRQATVMVLNRDGKQALLIFVDKDWFAEDVADTGDFYQESWGEVAINPLPSGNLMLIAVGEDLTPFRNRSAFL